MSVPSYYHSRKGRVFRVQRSQWPTEDGMQYALRAFAVQGVGGSPQATPLAELMHQVDAATLRDKIRLGQAVPPPEQIFEQLWQQVRLELDTL